MKLVGFTHALILEDVLKWSSVGRRRLCLESTVRRRDEFASKTKRMYALVKMTASNEQPEARLDAVDVDMLLPTPEQQTVMMEDDAIIMPSDGTAYTEIKSPPPPPAPEQKATRIQVITDIDDTVKSSGGIKIAGKYLGGVDTQYKRGECYPGVFQFSLELAANDLPENVLPLPMAVLTARAREFKFALALEEDHPICRKYRYVGMERGYDDWGIGPVLYGSVKEWVFQERKGLRKFRNFQLLQNYNNRTCGEDGSLCVTKYVYIGDTGELDLDAGKMMLKRYPTEMKAVFLHTVWDNHEGPPDENAWTDTEVKSVPVLYFRTYVGAARKAVEQNLIDEKALRRIASRALKDLLRIEPDHGSSKWLDLMRDIKEAELVPGKHWLWS